MMFKERANRRERYDHNSAMTLKILQYLEWMLSKNYSKYTVETRWYNLRYFIIWCEDRNMKNYKEVTPAVVEHYRMHLYHSRLPDGRPATASHQYTRLKAIAGFFRWLKKSRQILINPAFDMEFPKLGDPLPKYILSVEEAETVLNKVNLSNTMGYRDRAILEVFYSTGIRRLELMRLKLEDLDMERGVITIRGAKGNKDRVVPIGSRAIAWVEKYIYELRWKLCGEMDEGIVFLSRKGRSLYPDMISEIVGKYVRSSGIGKKGACHLFRHTMATLMLEGGADTRYIQQMLGHVRLETTQIYTRVTIHKLKEVHDRTHPGAKLKPKEEDKKDKENKKDKETKEDKENKEKEA